MVKPWADYLRMKDVERKQVSPGEVRALINSIDNPRDAFLLTLAYLTAGRIKEVLSITTQSFTVEEKKGVDVLLITMRNLKNRTVKTKIIPVRMDKEGDLANRVLAYVEGKEGSLFGFKTTRRARQIFKRYGYNPHFFRVLRLTHKTQYSGYHEQQLTMFAGWTDGRPASTYVRLRWEDLL